jgi:toxin ParE1/3/4
MQIKKTGLADEDLIDIFIYGSQNFGQSKTKTITLNCITHFCF